MRTSPMYRLRFPNNLRISHSSHACHQFLQSHPSFILPFTNVLFSIVLEHTRCMFIERKSHVVVLLYLIIYIYIYIYIYIEK